MVYCFLQFFFSVDFFCERISCLAMSCRISIRMTLDLGLNLFLILAGGVMVESLNRVGILFKLFDNRIGGKCRKRDALGEGKLIVTAVYF